MFRKVRKHREANIDLENTTSSSIEEETANYDIRMENMKLKEDLSKAAKELEDKDEQLRDLNRLQNASNLREKQQCDLLEENKNLKSRLDTEINEKHEISMQNKKLKEMIHTLIDNN